MTRRKDNPWLSRFAWLTALATLALICLGGLVTSHGAGLAVPDWPNTYGYNMFFFPVSMWVGGIFYEHTHRLVASGVGLLTTILAVWIWLKESRAWVRWLGVIAFVGVVVQGVLGGLRVTLIADELGIVHATLAQLFLVLVAALALFTSPRWTSAEANREVPPSVKLFFLCGSLLVLAQLILGATMRHQHAGLAIPDFPLAYGQVWPALGAEAIELYNQQRMEVYAAEPITAFQVILQMIHRIMALGILVWVIRGVRLTRGRLGGGHGLSKTALAWFVLVLVQFTLGAVTIWTNKSADITTLHVAVGAITLVVGSLGTIGAYGKLPAPQASHRESTGPLPTAAPA